ncbi:MAG: choice-of-anchor Q domain-containing protein [Crocinitomicaceae bacterium]
MKLILLTFFNVLFMVSYAQYAPGTVEIGTNGYIEYFPGDLPIIISAPHGGDLEPASIADRVCSSCVTVKDSWTMEVAKELDSAIQAVFGGHPHIIINRLHRKKLDANREIVEAALGNPEAETAWYEYHDYLQAAKNECVANYGSAIYIDMHAHGHPIQRIELGYLLTKTELQNTDPMLDILDFQDESSIKHLSNVINPTESFSEILRGNECMGEYLEDRGYPSVPSASDPAPAPADPYFSGGYNTARHGSRDSSSINGIQFELNYTGIRNTNANRHDFARSLACVLRSYLDQWYFDLDSWDPGNIVTTSADSGPGSLRSVLLGASDGDEITFDSSLIGDTIQLESELQVCSDVTISGLGAQALYLSGGDVTRIMRVMPGTQLEISDITLMNGSCPTSEDGGAVHVGGQMFMVRCDVKNNYADDDGGALNLSDSLAIITIDSCSIYDNTCGDDGGAIRIMNGTFNCKNSYIYDNTSPSFGGAISSNSIIHMDNSTFAGNAASGKGGVIRNFGTSLDSVILRNCTFSNNFAGNDGGAISTSCALELDFCTIVENEASVDGGGIEVTNVSPTIQNSIIAINLAPDGSDVKGTNVNMISNGYNFIGDSTGSNWIVATGDTLGNDLLPIDPLVDVLTNNGGNSPTIAITSVSACVDAANPIQFLEKDQRGFVRPSGNSPDIGAFELCQINSGIDSLQACESLTWIDGNTYFADTSGIIFALQNVNGCDSIVTLILEIPQIDTSLNVINNILSSNHSGDSYQWIQCDSLNSIISGATSVSYAPLTNGEYAVIITDNGCVDTSSCATVSTLGLLSVENPNQLRVYPNPSNGSITVSFDEVESHFEVNVYNLIGERLDDFQIHGQKDFQFNLPESKGVYYIEVVSQDYMRNRVKVVRN